ncbi:MAG: HAD family hydrolase [Roseibium sp.]|nr:HAD family hydrolase [Roseibium sp.]
MAQANSISAFIWDYDGTLVDSLEKNLTITRAIIPAVTGKDPSHYDPLKDLATYERVLQSTPNWRTFYGGVLGLTAAQVEQAGGLWSNYQRADRTPTPVFSHLEAAFAALGNYRHGVVSQNARPSIMDCLGQAGLGDHFDYVVGYQDVPPDRQKPQPDGLLMCIEALTGFDPGHVFYLGDHDTDIETARNANRVLKENGASTRVVAVAVTYSHLNARKWKSDPDFTAASPADIVTLAQEFERVP